MKQYHCPTRVDFAMRGFQSERSGNSQRTRKNRLALLKILSLAWASLLVFRLFSIQIANFEFWIDWASRQHASQMTVASERGPVLDRNNQILTVSVPVGSVFMRPKQVRDKALVAERVAPLLDMEPSAILQKFESKSPFVWLQRQVPLHEAKQVEKLELQGVGYMLEARRFYPYSFAASNLLGRVGLDGNGLSGIEAAFEKQLRGNGVVTKIAKDARGNTLHSAEYMSGFSLPKGRALQLTIDANIQMILDEELEAGRRKANAESGMAVMVDAETGEVLAMSQAPLVNFNENQPVSREHLRNKIIETVFEPGSIMKPLVAGAAIEMGLFSPTDLLDCEEGRYRFGGRTIKDVHGVGVASVRDIVVQSSNIGMSKIGAVLGASRLYAALRTYGFGETVDLGLPGQTAGILRHYQNWSTVDVATHSFGQGVAVTPLQVVRAMSAIANGGYLPELHVARISGAHQRKRILSAKTAATVRDMMFGVVEDEHGTARRARMDLVRVGGKTGTAQKARDNGRGYEPGAYVASFVGFVDASSIGVAQKLVLAVIIDEPNTTSIYGGTLAAPVFKRVMQKTLHHLSTSANFQSLSKTPSATRSVIPSNPDFLSVAYRQ